MQFLQTFLIYLFSGIKTYSSSKYLMFSFILIDVLVLYM